MLHDFSLRALFSVLRFIGKVEAIHIHLLLSSFPLLVCCAAEIIIIAACTGESFASLLATCFAVFLIHINFFPLLLRIPSFS